MRETEGERDSRSERERQSVSSDFCVRELRERWADRQTDGRKDAQTD